MIGKPQELREDDARSLLKLFEAAGPFVSPRSLSDYWLYTRLFSATCLCIRNNIDIPIAAVLAFRDQTPGVDEIYIQDVAVHPSSRRQGLAECLLAELHNRATDIGVRRIWLTSEVDNVGAMRLWAKFGYENRPADYQVGGVWLTSNLKGPGKDRAVYELLLRPSTPGTTYWPGGSD